MAAVSSGAATTAAALQVPLGLVAEFWTLEELLNARLVCRGWLECLHEGLSPEACAKHFADALMKGNLYTTIVKNQKSFTTRNEQEIASMLATTAGGDSLSCMLRFLRVFRYVPKEVAIAFHGKFGRHCLPLEWDECQGTTVAKSYAPCSRGKKTCRTCRIRVPTVESDGASIDSEDDESEEQDDPWLPTNNIDDHIVIRNKRGDRMNLKEYFNMCIPNMPNNLVCPICQVHDERTLLLFEMSYPCAPGGESYRQGQILLTYTPKYDDNENDIPQQQNEVSQASNPKRPRLYGVDESPLSHLPLMYEDMAIPNIMEPLQRKNDAKHAIAVQCVKCNQFRVVAPAAPCLNSTFPCLDRGRTLEGMNQSMRPIIGGVFVRNKCDVSDCNHPIYCERCSRNPETRGYSANNQDIDDGGPLVVRTRCYACNNAYCEHHQWLSTSCCHC